MSLFIILFLIVLAVGAYVVMTYNSVIAKIEAVENSKRQIDVQLDRRFKVFEGLINTVKKVMDYEQTTLKDVIALRNSAIAAKNAGDVKGQFEAEDKISQIASSVNMVFEQYPALKATENALQLQEEIVSTENKLSFAKQSYNDSVEDYNVVKKSFFSSMVVSAFAARLSTSFQYWAISQEKSKQYEEMTAKF